MVAPTVAREGTRVQENNVEDGCRGENRAKGGGDSGGRAPPSSSIIFPTVMREGKPCGFMMRSGHTPASLKGKSSCGVDDRGGEPREPQNPTKSEEYQRTIEGGEWNMEGGASTIEEGEWTIEGIYRSSVDA
eukprot:1023102-Prorocentrum_minimum.AAC.1